MPDATVAAATGESIPDRRKSLGIDPRVPPSGTGCVECLATHGWWLHLRRCAACGHVGCCDSSPSQHASKHALAQNHPIAQSYEPDENWFWDYELGRFVDGPQLHPPASHPRSQPSPGPAGAVPRDWKRQLH
ncbi:UBP-type zinc finger domain-containing protein [Mycobacterium intracellulare]|uniref:UBP-type zinc finger domain-containing protein n=1 Tax=Mycobacterium intracellulare TaxID=1767 RepID=UPI0009B8A1A1|nr:UBP-type zinc finger domain-containing protein [Mycobacterium intracellulare]MCA2273952.1 UBP-type zinc finger domain-containing protein [Mycobacterium intracellulare]MCA2324673.1 UBP-type zinc finger domain-containing protein [Mycobacterium intracellulare]UEB22626.1 UBP-type zinc finger domain-containing protein [Mycobacterium intracellulare]WVL05608.1 UBP-type zinc finger domain-containing protein [Mycobacterium intracellulare]